MTSAEFEIRPLHAFTRDEIWPILSGYETSEIYTVEKTETDLQTRFDIRLVQLEAPYRTNFEDDFRPEDLAWYQGLTAKGYAFGAYQHDRLIGFAIGEAFPDEQYVRVWEFHVMAEFRRMGVGRALMQREIVKARQDGLRMMMLETQNTNMKAIRFYRKMGFSLESIDLWHYFALEAEQASQTAFFMKLRL